MSTTESNYLEIQTLKGQIADILGNSKTPSEGEPTSSYTDDTLIPIQNVGEDVKFIKRSDFLVAILGSLRRIDDDSEINEVTAVNQICIGKKAGVNSGGFFIARVVVFPPTLDSHFEFIYRTL